MSIYQPYTYVLTHLPTGRRYYGVRVVKGCSPSDLWASYYSSSKVVKRLIAEDGYSSFAFEVRKVFKTRTEAQKWEHKVLRRLKAAQSDRWLNLSNGAGTFYFKEHTETSKGKLRKSAVGRVILPSTKEKMSFAATGRKATPETKLKMAAARKLKWIVTPPNGSSETVINLSAYCQEHGLHRATMTKVGLGERSHHKGYRCERVCDA